MRKTLAQAKASTIPQAVGYPSCDARLVTLLNEAQQRLADMGRWWGTYKKLRVCVTDGCITWPREVKNVEALKVCGYSVPIRNGWYEFQETVAAPYLCDEDTDCGLRELLDRSAPPSPQFRDTTQHMLIRIYCDEDTDWGERVLLQGNDGNGVPIRTQDGAHFVNGEYVTLADPFVTSTFQFDPPGLLGAQKPVTDGRLTVYSVHPVTGDETLIATWEPGEENPAYRRNYITTLPGSCGGDCDDCGDGCAAEVSCATGNVVDAIVRLECLPALVDEDWLFIGNLDALKHMMKAIQKEDRNEYAEGEREVQLAIRALRNELEAYSPRSRNVVNVQTHGTAHPRRVFSGFI